MEFGQAWLWEWQQAFQPHGLREKPGRVQHIR